MQSNSRSDARSAAGRSVPGNTLHRTSGQPPPKNTGNDDTSIAGHVRHPVLAREQSTLESIRSLTISTLRTQLPSVFSPAASRSPHAPGASPPSQHRSTALSYGSFVGTGAVRDGPQTDRERGMLQHYPMMNEMGIHEAVEHIHWASYEEVVMDSQRRKRRLLFLAYTTSLQIWDFTDIDALREVLNVDVTSLVSSAGLWNVSGAVALPGPSSKYHDELADSRPLLALTVKDVSQSSYLCAPTEVIIYSLRTHAVVKRLGAPHLDDPKFGLEASSTDGSEPAEDFCNVSEIAANSAFVVISTHSPSTIHILSSSTLNILHTLPSAYIVSSPPSSSSPPPHPIFALSPRFLAYASPPPLPHHRIRNPGPGFLSSTPASSAASPNLQSIGSGVEMVGSGAKKVGEGVWMGVKALGGFAYGAMSQAVAPTPAPAPAPYRQTPGREGGPFFSRSAPAAGEGGLSPPPGLLSLGSPSMSPLSPPGSGHRRGGGAPGEKSVLNPPVENGYITVLDLSPLWQTTTATGGRALQVAQPVLLAHFLATGSSTPSSSTSHHAPAIQMMSFSPSGTLLCVSDVLGHISKIFQIRGGLSGLRSGAASVGGSSGGAPAASGRRAASAGALTPITSNNNSRRRSSGASSNASSNVARGTGGGDDSVWHLYDLYRGSTTAKISSISWAHDARWIGVGTARGTLHVFAINPYGGRPDEATHLDGRVRNPMELQPLSVTVHPVGRLRASTGSSGSSAMRDGSMTAAGLGAQVPVFIFVPPAVSRTSALLAPRPGSEGLPRATSSSRAPPALGRTVSDSAAFSLSSTKRGFQDVLAFCLATGQLALRRCTIYPVAAASADPNATVKAPRRPSTASEMSRSGVSMMMSLMGGVGVGGGADEGMGMLKASDALVASWELRKEKGWSEVRDAIVSGPGLRPDGMGRRRENFSGAADALSQAELSTSSRSPRILPPPIYLQHQFNFFALREDWQALLRRARLDLPSRRIEVRKEVEISPQAHHPSSSLGEMSDMIGRTRSEEHETFIQQSTPSHHSGSSVLGTSFEKPIASAIHTNLEAQSAPSVIPSFPNAYNPGSSWRGPVRTVAAGVADGVTEGIGLIKREVRKARRVSQQGRHQATAPSLVFEEDEEEDEAFANRDASRQEDVARSPASGWATPATSANVSLADQQQTVIVFDDTWGGERDDDEITKALDEEAKFDDLGVPGFMLEEEEERQKLMDQVAAVTTTMNKGAQSKKSKGA